MNILAEKIKKLKIETYNLDRSIDKHTFDKMTIIENVNNIELIMEKNNIKIIEIEGECDDL